MNHFTELELFSPNIKMKSTRQVLSTVRQNIFGREGGITSAKIKLYKLSVISLLNENIKILDLILKLILRCKSHKRYQVILLQRIRLLRIFFLRVVTVLPFCHQDLTPAHTGTSGSVLAASLSISRTGYLQGLQSTLSLPMRLPFSR